MQVAVNEHQFSRVSRSCRAQEFVKRLVSKRGELLRFLMLAEERALSMLLLTVSQKIVEVPTVQELVIGSGNNLKFRLWSGSTPNWQVATVGAEFHVNSHSSCVSAYFHASCTECPFVSVCHTRVSARLLTHPLQLFRNSKHLHIPSVSRFAFQWTTLHGSGAVMTRGTHW